MREMSTEGWLDDEVACSRLDVMYSSSWGGRNTQASWKKGVFDVFAVESRRECVGVRPTRCAKET